MIPFHTFARGAWLATLALSATLGLSACSPNDNLTDPTQPNPVDFAPIAAAANASLVVLTTDGQLLVTNAPGPGAEVRAPVAITGLGPDETIRGIDFRVSANGTNTGTLYGIGVTAAAAQVAPFSARLYTIDRFTGVATLVGGATFSVNSVNVGFDFNPTALAAVRVVSDAEDNLSVDADTGIATANTLLTPAGSVAGAAYTNTYPGSLGSTLYVIDYASDSLLRQGGVDGTPSPDGGVLTPVGALGVAVGADLGFDIDGFSGTAYLGAGTSIYRVSLSSGAATLVGTVADGSLSVRDIAVTVPTSALGFGARNSGPTLELVTFGLNAATATPTIVAVMMNNSDRSATTDPVAFNAGATVIGMDFRPNPTVTTSSTAGESTLPEGELFALIQDGAETCLYSVALVNVAATTYSDVGVATPFDLYPLNADDPDSIGVQCAIDTLVHVDDDDDPDTDSTDDDGVAGTDTPVGFAAGLTGTSFGFDFNPVADRLRLVSDAGENLRLNQTSGAVVDGDATTDGTQGDTALSGDATVPVAAAYTNSYPLQFRTALAATSSTLFVIDPSTDMLARQGAAPGTTGACPADVGNPNCGVTTNIGATGIDFGSDTSFDIIGGSTAGSTNYVNAVAYAVSGNNLYRVNLVTGAATLVGLIGGTAITASTVQLKR